MDENNTSPLNLNITIATDNLINSYKKVLRPPTPIPEETEFLMNFITEKEPPSVDDMEELIKHKIESLKQNVYIGKIENNNTENIPQAPPLMYSPNTYYENSAVEELNNMEDPFGKHVHFYSKKEMDYYMYQSFNNGIWIIVTKQGKLFTTYQKWLN